MKNGKRTKTAKILFIDDDKSIFNLIKTQIKGNGLKIIWTGDGQEGIKIAKSEMPDILVTDVLMPHVNGFEIVKRMKENPLTKDIKCIILTNYGETRLVYDKNFHTTLGVVKYLIKSNHTPKEIAKEIKSALA